MPTIRRFPTAEASRDALDEIRRLLDDAFDGEFSEDDWDHTLGGCHVVVEDGGAIVSHAAVVLRLLEVAEQPFRTGYVEGVGTDPARQGEGLASLAMTEAASLVQHRFELGALSTGEHGFYERLGWERWRGPTFARHDGEMVRTEDEDDGIMVLRFGPSAGVDLAGSIVCEGRRGDDW